MNVRFYLLENLLKGVIFMVKTKQSIHVLEAKGNKHFSKEEIEKRKAAEPDLIDDGIKVPEYLPVRLKNRFDWYVKELKRLKIIGNTDSESLARYLVSEDRYQVISKEILKLDPVKNYEKMDQLSKLQTKFYKQARESGNDLGLSISSRGKLVIPSGEKEKDKAVTDEERLFGKALGD